MPATPTFTEPKTWAFQEGVESSELNTIRDILRSMGPHLIARKGSDQSVASTTLANDNTLFTPSIAANEVWYLRLVHFVVTGAGAMKTAYSIPTGSELQRTITGSNGTVVVEHIQQTASDTPVHTYIAGAATGRLYLDEMLFINAGTAGAVTLRIALNSASGTSTSKANSTLWGVQLA